MAVPPSFADLGKSAKDIFNKGYGYGMMNLDVKTKTLEGEFKMSGSMNMDTNRVTGTQENQYKWPQHGLTFTEKWTTENTLGAGVCVEDKIAKGLKLSFDTMFSPNTGKKSNLLKTAYKREYLNAGLDVDLDFAGPTLHGAAVGGYKGWLGGCQMTYDSTKSKMTQGNISLGYKTENTQIHTNMYVCFKPDKYLHLFHTMMTRYVRIYHKSAKNVCKCEGIKIDAALYVDR
uniref:Non-selective voltage-gated ion channel VDAC2 n=1 Tax=Gouania willdenowi TaxID=441366 RepID=A0A8C5ICE4_GOUWI